MIHHTIATTRTGAPILQPMSIDLQDDWHFYTYIMGGCIDAPDIPAGSTRATKYDNKGNVAAFPTRIIRD